jgi:hypothetical protein
MVPTVAEIVLVSKAESLRTGAETSVGNLDRMS